MKIIFILTATISSFFAIHGSYINSASQKAVQNQSFVPADSGDSAILEKYWKLVTLNQMAVTSRDAGQSEPHMILKKFKKEVRGNGGCNSFTATYELKDSNTINISPVIAGENGCKNLRTENQFFKFLSKVKSYEVVGDSLFMQDATGRLSAKFVAVYL